MVSFSSNEIGYIGVVGAILFFGSFGVPLKSKRVQEANVDPVVFQCYYSITIFISSWIVLAWVEPFDFTYYGIIGACLWVPASILSIFAINHLGMSVAVGMWCGVTIVTSFVWGAVAFPAENHINNLPLSILGLVLLVIGILGLSLSNTERVKNFGKKKEAVDSINGTERISLLNGEVVEEDKFKPRPIIGIACSIALGLMNGSIMVPLHYAPKDAGGMIYVVSFGIGVICVTPVVGTLYFLAMRKMPVWKVKETMIPGLITGLIWNIGNFCSIIATIHLGLTVGFPLTQLALVVSGLWGLLVFKELKGAITITVWVISLLILLGGAALLAVYG